MPNFVAGSLNNLLWSFSNFHKMFSQNVAAMKYSFLIGISRIEIQPIVTDVKPDLKQFDTSPLRRLAEDLRAT